MRWRVKVSRKVGNHSTPRFQLFHIKPPPSLVFSTTVSQLVLAVCLLAQGYTLSILLSKQPWTSGRTIAVFPFCTRLSLFLISQAI